MFDEHAWRVAETADYLCTRGYKTVTLQFPDALLPSAAGVAVALHDACAAQGHAVQVSGRTQGGNACVECSSRQAVLPAAALSAAASDEEALF
mgnify:CR=1 FL=1